MPVPADRISPNYGLITQTSTLDSGGAAPTQTVQTQYDRPENGLANRSIVDPEVPGGPAELALTSITAYEEPGSGYLRRIARTLPAGSATTTTDVHYSPTDSVTNPCPAGGAGHQRGRPKFNQAATDSTGKRLVREQVYDAKGRTVASRIRQEGPTADVYAAEADKWTCTTYDSRGRLSTVRHPIPSSPSVRIVTYNYAVKPAGQTVGDPLVTSVSDPATGHHHHHRRPARADPVGRQPLGRPGHEP